MQWILTMGWRYFGLASSWCAKHRKRSASDEELVEAYRTMIAICQKHIADLAPHPMTDQERAQILAPTNGGTHAPRPQ